MKSLVDCLLPVSDSGRGVSFIPAALPMELKLRETEGKESVYFHLRFDL